MTKRMAILGCGAVGGSLGAYLLKAGHEVTLIDQWAEHIDKIRETGLKLTEPNREFVVHAKALHISDVSSIKDKFDIVFLSVKSFDTRWSAYLVEPFLDPAGFIVPIQNSLNDELIASIVGFPRTIGCVTTIDAELLAPGHVVRLDYENNESFIVGELHGMITPRIQTLVDYLSVLGPGRPTTNIWGVRWSKLVYNSMNNALSGLIGPVVFSLDQKQWETSIEIRMVTTREAVSVAQKLGISLEPIAGIPVNEFTEATDAEGVRVLKHHLDEKMRKKYFESEAAIKLGIQNRPSLLQDVIKGRKTEIDYLNGLIVRKGEEVGVKTPMNQAIVGVVRKIECGELKPDPSNLAFLLPYLELLDTR